MMGVCRRYADNLYCTGRITGMLLCVPRSLARSQRVVVRSLPGRF